VTLLTLVSQGGFSGSLKNKSMKTSRKKFVSLFLISGFAFLFIYNVTIRSVVQLLPESSESFLGSDSLTGWKSTVSTILYPLKIVLAGPMIPLIDLPDPPPPFLVIGFAIYWTILALVIHYLVRIIKRSQLKA
jgi:hypothetical protein